ncbi:helix-turn-helix domain-containing protein [Bordetella petrii]|uniref:helix-turn-helix domain-containing protein n=1 Tax=Bordetella petrii TaxID=94624 RepID=UPI0004AECAB7|nr:helix-turn-helix transcriptional regulator [Bordetella petrii]
MKTLSAIAAVLRQRLRERGQTQASLREAAGVAQRTLTNVLSGEQDFKVSTLLALADRLGLEVLLVPKGAAPAFDAAAPSKPVVPTRIQVARKKIPGEPR